MNEELLQKAVMMQQESQETERKLELIEEQLRELDEFSKGLELFEKSKEKEMLASFGKGVYVKSEIKDEKLFVNVGVGVVVRKSAAETKEIIQGCGPSEIGQFDSLLFTDAPGEITQQEKSPEINGETF